MSAHAAIESLKRYPSAILSVVVILVCLVLYLLRGDIAAELEMTESASFSRIRLVEKNTANAVGITADLELLNTKVEAIQQRLFNRDQKAVITNFFYALEDDAELLITSISQVPTEDVTYSKGGSLELQNYLALSYELILEATFKEFLKVLYTLHTADPFIRVVDYQLTSEDVSSSSAILKIRVRLVVLAKKN